MSHIVCAVCDRAATHIVTPAWGARFPACGSCADLRRRGDAKTVTISDSAYENLRHYIIAAHRSGAKSRVNAEAQLEFLKKYRRG